MEKSSFLYPKRTEACNKKQRKGGSNTGNLTETLMEELNCKTVLKLPVLGGISESVVVTWIIMAVLVLLSIILVRNLKVENPGKVQLALESMIGWAQDFFEGIIGKKIKLMCRILSRYFFIWQCRIRSDC